MRRLGTSVAVLALAAGIAGLIAGVPYGAAAGRDIAALVAVCGAGGLALAHLAVAWRRHLGGLRRQFAVAAGIALAIALAAVIAAAERMFVSHHDATVVSAVVIGAAVVAVRAAQLLSAAVARDVDSVRSALAAVGAGERNVSIRRGGGDEVAELAGDVEAMVELLRAEEHRRGRADRARRDLVAAVSHDLRTPLASLRLLAGAVEDGLVEGEERTRYLAEMQSHIHALSSMIDDLFELSRLEAGDIEWSMQQVEVARLVDQAVAAMRPQARSRGVEVVAEPTAEPTLARADPERLQRVLFNLISNAIRHTPSDGSVTVRTESAAGAVEVEVADTGEGIAPDERERVFEAFVRGRAGEARAGDGAGLGLAIARAIVEGHGGRIWLAPSARGTRVRFSVPA